MEIMRIVAKWSGFNGAPGYSNFYFAGGGGVISDASQAAGRVRDALGDLEMWLPGGVSIQIEPEVARIDSDSGVITGFEAIEQPTAVTGTGSGGYSAASGAVITWRTNDLRGGRRIRGRTFLVPLSGSCYQSDGTIQPAVRADLQALADGLVGGDFDSELGVWSRPINGSGGVFATVVQAHVPDMAAILRSRRD